MQPFGHAHVVHAAHIRMGYLARDANLVAEAGERRLREVSRYQKLQGHGLIQDEIEGLVDLSHAALPQQAQNPVSPGQDGAGWKAALFRSTWGPIAVRDHAISLFGDQHAIDLGNQLPITSAGVLQISLAFRRTVVERRLEDASDALETLGCQRFSADRFVVIGFWPSCSPEG